MKNLIKTVVILALTSVMTAALAQDLRSTLTQAQAYFDRGEAATALAMLRPIQKEYAGSGEFDHLLALALLETGAASEAEIVFERVLANNPEQHGVRLDLARALFAQNKLREATLELDQLNLTSPPPRAVQAISQMRTAINHRSRRLKFSKRLAIHTAAGYDSNVSSSTAADSFLGFQLDSESQEQESDFLQFGIDGAVGYRLSQNLSVSASAGIRQRNNSQASFVDSRVLRGDLGLNFNNATDSRRLGLSMYQLDVDGDKNSQGLRLHGNWMRKLNDVWRIGVGGDVGRIEFTDDLAVKDVDRTSGGVLLDRRVGPDAQGVWTLQAGIGHDEPVADGSRYTRDFYYASSGLNWAFSETFRSSFQLSYRASQYDEVFFEQLYTDAREDKLYRMSGSINWAFRDAWMLTHSLGYSHNATFIDIFEYERFEASLQLNYVFR